MIYHAVAYNVALSDVVANLDLISQEERYKHKIAATGVTDPYDPTTKPVYTNRQTCGIR